ncbi:hypothetical protein McpSp1_09340 [Methanocorpusculaceae archaeon Sp1]|nr:hypothetical protein [Methanocorpusculaceae archaeon Sp1]
MYIKHLVAIFLLAALLFSGAAAAEATSLTLNVYDNSASHDPVKDAKVVITKGGLDQTLYTDVNGRAKFAAVEYQSTYTVSISKDGYDTQKFSLTINVMDKDYTVYLQKSNLIQVKVLNPDKSTPVSGAKIAVDGLTMGTTNSAGVLHVSMEKGAYHNVQVTADSYETYSSSQYIDSDQTSLTITLSKSYLSPRVLVYDTDKKPIPAASVIIDEKTTVYTDEYGRASLSKLTAGTYDLKVTKTNYVPYTKKVTFSEDSSDVVVELTYESVPVTVLVVDGTTPVAGALVSLDNLVTGVTDATGKFTKTMSPGQTVLFAASKDGYTGTSISYQITTTGDNTITLPMTPNFPTPIVVGCIVAVIVIVILVFLFTRTRRPRRNNDFGRRGF